MGEAAAAAAKSSEWETNLLFVLLVDGVHCVLYRHAFEISGGDFETEGEVELDLLDGGSYEEHFQDVFVLNCVW